MNEAANLVDIAAQLADRSRMAIILQLMDGSSKTASELAFAANLSAPSASMHLAKLVQARVLAVTTQGRNKYYRIANHAIAHAIEALSAAANFSRSDGLLYEPKRSQIPNPWAFARTCYDHLAGRLGVELASSLQQHEYLKATGGEYELMPDGKQWLNELNIDSKELYAERRTFATPCLDWTEQRYHIGGALGAALLTAMLKLGWLGKSRIPRLVRLTVKGEMELNRRLSMNPRKQQPGKQ